MIFNGTSGDSIIEDITFRSGVDTEAFPLIDRTRYANEAYSRVVSIIIRSDGRMQWDDPNHTDAPTSVTDLALNQRQYDVFAAAPTALKDWLMIERVEMKDEAGNWSILYPIDHKDIQGAEGEFMKEAGTPVCFDFNGSQVTLYPKSSFSVTGGLRFFFKRAPSYFASSDTTKRPGFATLYHSYIPIYVSHVWRSTKLKDFSLQAELTRLEAGIGTFYARRPSKIQTQRLSNKRSVLMK